MTTQFELSAQPRKTLGTGASRRLRRLENRVPAILYGGGEPPLSLSLDHNQLIHALENEAFYSHILTVHFDGHSEKAVLKDLQRHPYKPRILHLDLLRVTAKEKISMTVPLHFKGEYTAPGVKDEGGILSKLLNSVEVRCLPDVLPEYLDVDVSRLKINESIQLSQIPLPLGVELVALLHGDNLPVVNIHPPRAASEKEESTTTPEAAAVPTINVKEEGRSDNPSGKDKK